MLAKKGAFHGRTDSLLSRSEQKQYQAHRLWGNAKMHRADYASPAYSKAEWRHVLNSTAAPT